LEKIKNEGNIRRITRSTLRGSKITCERRLVRDEKDLVLDALRRYVDTHKSELMEDFVRKDVEWDCMVKNDSRVPLFCDAGRLFTLTN